MPEKETLRRARADKRAGKSPTTQAGEFVREEIHHVREGKHGARSAKQAIAIGLSKARRSGVNLCPAGQRQRVHQAKRQVRAAPGRQPQTFDQARAGIDAPAQARIAQQHVAPGALASGQDSGAPPFQRRAKRGSEKSGAHEKADAASTRQRQLISPCPAAETHSCRAAGARLRRAPPRPATAGC